MSEFIPGLIDLEIDGQVEVVDEAAKVELEFTETVSNGKQSVTRTASITVAADSDCDKVMEFLKRAVREPETKKESE